MIARACLLPALFPHKTGRNALRCIFTGRQYAAKICGMYWRIVPEALAALQCRCRMPCHATPLRFPKALKDPTGQLPCAWQKAVCGSCGKLPGSMPLRSGNSG